MFLPLPFAVLLLYKIAVEFFEFFPNFEGEFYRVRVIFVQHGLSVRVTELVLAVFCVLNHRNVGMVAHAEPFAVNLLFMPLKIVFHFFTSRQNYSEKSAVCPLQPFKKMQPQLHLSR